MARAQVISTFCQPVGRTVWDSAAWVTYYESNAKNLGVIPWERGGELSTEERASIAASVQDFQLGESSEGLHLQRCAKEWAEKTGDRDYPEAIRLFTKEEQRHASNLADFLKLNGIGLISKSWTDALFRRVRRMAGLELSIRVLLCAEIVAQVYYDALRDATNSSVLRAICDQILKDEAEHVRFQCERLAIFARKHGAFARLLRNCFQYSLMTAVLPIVWVRHRRAYLAGGYHARRFAKETWLAFRRGMAIADPSSYE
ncbi:MAG: ferritin-like domain-containing protein [Armatimonadetes bacterium]|nr:ferritin-like domain-containing protein [Armatimonadota bacterium]